MSNRKTTFSTGFDSVKFSPPKVDASGPAHDLANLQTRLDAGGVNTDPRNGLEKLMNLNPTNGFWGDVAQTWKKTTAGSRGAVNAVGHWLTSPSDSKSFTDDLNHLTADPVNAFAKGWNDPSTAPTGRQMYNDTMLGQRDIPYLSGVGGFGVDVATDITSYLPVGKALSGVAKLTGLNKVGAAVKDSLTGGSKVAAKDAQVAGLDTQISNLHDRARQLTADFNAKAQSVPGGIFEHNNGLSPHDPFIAEPRIAPKPIQTGSKQVAGDVGGQFKDFNLPAAAGAKIAEVPTDFKLPRSLEKSAPRYRTHTVEFASDLDKALYVVGNTTTKSKGDAAFVKALADHTGMSESSLRSEGAKVRQAIKNASTGAQAGEHIKLSPVSTIGKAKTPNPHASQIKEVDNTIADLQHQHDSLAKSLVDDLNKARGEGIASKLKSANVRRPLKGEAAYNEFRALPDNIKRLFKPGNSGKSALSLDEFAAENNLNGIRGVLDALNNSNVVKHTLADVAGHPELATYRELIDQFKALRQEAQATHDAWMPPVGLGNVAQRATVGAAHAGESLADNANFDSLIRTAPAAKPSAKASQTLSALENLHQDQMSPLQDALKSLELQRMGVAGADPRNLLQRLVGSTTDALGKTFVKGYGLDRIKGRDGVNLGDLVSQFGKNSGFLMGKAVDESANIVKKFGLKTDDRKFLAQEMEKPGSVPDARIQQAAQKLQSINNDWWAMAQSAGYNVGYLQDYVKHLLTPEGRKYLKALGENPGSLSMGAQSPLTRKRALEAKRVTDGTIDEINASKGFDFMETDGIKAAMAGNVEKAKGIAAQQFMNEIYKTFGVPFAQGEAKQGYQLFRFNDKDLFGILPNEKVMLPDAVVQQLQTMMQGGKSSAGGRLFGAITNIWKTAALTNPAFHTRNFIDNVWRNGLAGIVNPRYYTDAAKVLKGNGEVVVNGQKVPSATVLEWFQREGAKGGQFSEMGSTSALDKKLNWASKTGVEKLKSMNVVQMSRSIGDKSDDFTRMAHFLGRLDEGMDMKQAADSVKHFLIDYRNLTESEKKMRQFIPFYTFFRHNFPFQVGQFLTNTKAYSSLGHAVEDRHQSLGIDQSTEPDYLRQQFAMPLWKDDAGKVHYFAPGLSAADLAKTDLTKLPKTITGMLSPFMKLPIEESLNMDSFTGKPIEKFAGETKPFLGMDLSPKVVHAMQSLAPPLRDANNIITPDVGKDATIPTYSAIVKTVDPKQGALSQQYNEVSRLQDLIKSTNAQKMQQLQNAGATPAELSALKTAQDAAHGFVPTMKDLKKPSVSTEQKIVKMVAKLATVKTSKPKKPKKVHAKKPKVTKSKAPSVHAMKKMSKPKLSVQKLKKLKSH